jgi:hypothetical protein
MSHLIGFDEFWSEKSPEERIEVEQDDIALINHYKELFDEEN